MLKHIIDEVRGKDEYKFRITNTEMFQVLNSKEFVDLKKGYIKLYDKIGKDAPDGWELKNEMNMNK